ncbi:hypothetical protein QUA92_20780, partial [Microcoleus sp. F8-C1]
MSQPLAPGCAPENQELLTHPAAVESISNLKSQISNRLTHPKTVESISNLKSQISNRLTHPKTVESIS